jgi:hypothetical protein
MKLTLSRSRSGLTNKLHVVTDARGQFVRGGLAASQCHDALQALPQVDALAPAYLVAARSTCTIMPYPTQTPYPACLRHGLLRLAPAR